MSDYDRDKIVECMFDPVTAAVLAELETGKQSATYLAKTQDITAAEIDNKLGYLVQCGFVEKEESDNTTFYSANLEKLSKFVEEDNTFDSAIDGLTKMDSYLN